MIADPRYGHQRHLITLVVKPKGKPHVGQSRQSRQRRIDQVPLDGASASCDPFAAELPVPAIIRMER